MKIVVLVVVLLAVWYFFMRKSGKLDFWKLAAKNPDTANDFFIANDCWKIFEGGLPDDYRTVVPKALWAGPYYLVVPKLGNQTVYVFGRHPEYMKSQDDFIRLVHVG